LVKGREFFLIFSPKPMEIATAAGFCAILCIVVLMLRRSKRRLETAERGSKNEVSVSAEAGNR
jgi:hypothetical protein